MGRLLKGLEGEWGEPIPCIQSLVVGKTGKVENRGLPSDGIKEFWPDYPQMSRAEKEAKTNVEYQRIVNFGSRWNDVLEKLNLPPVTVDIPPEKQPEKVKKPFGTGGESIEHKNLKEYVRQHPEIVGAGHGWKAFIEYPLPSNDEIDVVFKSADVCIAVEVKAAVSDALPFDYKRGLYQTIKYGALLKAMNLAGGHEVPPTIKSVLVLESSLPEEYRKLAEVLGVTVFENVGHKQ